MTAPENDFPRAPLFDSEQLGRDFSDMTELAIRLHAIADEIQAQNKKDRRTIQTHRYGISFDDTVRLDELPATEPLPDVGIYVTKRATGDYYVSVVHDTDAPMGMVSFVHPILINRATGKGHTNNQAKYGLMDPASFRRHYVPYLAPEERKPLVPGGAHYDSRHLGFLAFVQESAFEPDDIVTFTYPHARMLVNDERYEFRPQHGVWEGKMTAATFLKLFSVKNT